MTVLKQQNPDTLLIIWFIFHVNNIKPILFRSAKPLLLGQSDPL